MQTGVKRSPAAGTAAGAEDPRAVFVDGMGRIADFWGVGRVMGRLWGVLYLSQTPLSMDELGQAVGVTKGHVSTNLRSLERLHLVDRSAVGGERKERYRAETDFWRFVQRIMREREQKELEHAIGSVERSLAALEHEKGAMPGEEYRFLRERLRNIHGFYVAIGRMVEAVLALNDLGSAAGMLVPARLLQARRRRSKETGP
jgi:HTH-type transcriptional regulator, glycine betaine synthesis regulator